MPKKPARPPAKKKAPAKKIAAKKPAPKKPAAKKAVVKKPADKKPALKIVPSAKMPAKKPLASLQTKGVQTSTATKASRITPIKAPQIVVAPQTKTSATKMSVPVLPPNYEPNDKEEFMNPVMKEYFRQRLLAWRDELLRESETTLHVLQEDGNMQKPDLTDRASEETDLAIEFRIRDRERKLLNKINEAIQRIEEGTFGYCEETGDPISVKRLMARPTVTMTLEAQELHERRERTQRDQYE